MKKFIERIKNAYNYEHCFDQEPIYFQAFIMFGTLLYWIGKTIFTIMVAVTSPIWIIPYAIYWIKNNKDENDDE